MYFLVCMWCDRSESHTYPSELIRDSMRRGWHDIHAVSPGGDDEHVTHHGTCPGCIWEHSTQKSQAVS